MKTLVLLALVCSFPSAVFAQAFTSSQDVGPVGAAGSSSYSNGVYTISGSGEDVWNTSDEFRYTYATLTGDGQVTAHIDSLNALTDWTKAGVMIRETLSANSRYAYALVSGTGGADLQWRSTVGGLAQSGGPDWVSRAPYWVRLNRAGNVFTAYVSADGSTWRQQGSVSISMASSVYVGLAVTSHWDGQLATAKFSSVQSSASATSPTTSPPSTTTPPPSTTTPPPSTTTPPPSTTTPPPSTTTPPPSTTTPPPTSTTGSATLTWTPPTRNTDGSTLTDLFAFKVYWGTSSGTYSNQIVINNPLAATWTINNLAVGRWYFAVTALNIDGIESVKSTEASKLVQ